MIGEKEAQASGLAPRRHGGEDMKQMPLADFAKLLKEEARPPFGT